MNNKNARLRQLCLGLIILISSTNYLFSQNKAQISPKKLIKDFNQLEKIITAHPDPYTHISKKEFKANLKKIKSSLDRPHSTLEFYKKTASVVALIKDGHSSVRLPRFWLQTLRRKRGAFPYEVYLTNEDELYTIKNFNDSPIPVGAKIVSINGISVDSFLSKIDPYISYEKKNFRNTIIDQDFEKYLYVAFGSTDSLTMEYFTTSKLVAEIKNMPYKDWKKFQRKDKDERDIKIAQRDPYSYKKIADGVGLINVYAFRTSNIVSYNLFLHKTFKKIRHDKIHSLIIDIRGNFGGWPKIASRLFHYISNCHFKTMGKSSMKVSHAYRNNLFDRYPSLRRNSGFSYPIRHYVDINAAIKNPIDSYVDKALLYNEKPINETFEFEGDCYLLTNRDSYSAASGFAATFQCYGMGTIIGEETGGTKIFRANAIYESLNKSELWVGMSTIKNWNTCYNEEFQGVLPTIKYIPSILEIISDMDTQLLFTQRVIRRHREKARP